MVCGIAIGIYGIYDFIDQVIDSIKNWSNPDDDFLC